MSVIGIYVHHHGDGHRQRALSIAKQAPEYFTLLGTNLAGKCENIPFIELADDRCDEAAKYSQDHLHQALHYAPIYHDGIRKRNASISSWIVQNAPAFMMIDVSVEVAMLAHLCSTPFIYTRLSGDRTDVPHELIFKAATRVFCPFHKKLENPDTADWLKAKSVYFSGLSQTVEAKPHKTNTLLFVLGSGGHNITTDQLCALALNLNDWEIDVIGPIEPHNNLPQNLKIHGWVQNPSEYIARSEIIAGACGDGLLSDVMSLGKPFIALPQHRPYDEQLQKAQQLAALDAAVICEFWPVDWKKTVGETRQLGSKISKLHDADGPKKAANFLISLAQKLQTSRLDRA